MRRREESGNPEQKGTHVRFLDEARKSQNGVLPEKPTKGTFDLCTTGARQKQEGPCRFDACVTHRGMGVSTELV